MKIKTFTTLIYSEGNLLETFTTVIDTKENLVFQGTQEEYITWMSKTN